jgi:[lysine-biosynthesis-protein LysW]--L-2-aminoadipate ligase
MEEKAIFAALERRRAAWVHLDPRRFVAEIPASRPAFCRALNREMSQARALAVGELLESAGTPTVNAPSVIACCGDKLRTSLALAAAGVPAPRTVVALGPEAAMEAMERIGFPVVVKPVVGSWGRLSAVVRDRETASIVLEHREALQSPQRHVTYVQELVDSGGSDLRMIVVGDEVLGAVRRVGRDWRANVARGGESTPFVPGDELVKLALDAARAVGGGILGVDLVEDGDRRPLVLEVNHRVEFAGFQAAHTGRVDVAEAIVDHLCAGEPGS